MGGRRRAMTATPSTTDFGESAMPRDPNPYCSFGPCDRVVYKKGLCAPHYAQKYTKGKPLKPLRKPLVGTPKERFWYKVDKNGPFAERLGSRCWVWTGPTTTGANSCSGYGVLAYGGSPSRQEVTHRFSWRLHNGPIPEGLLVLHKCDNPPCCNPDHLYKGTYQDNADDRVRRGRQPQGEAHSSSKLTETQVRAIRQDYTQGLHTYPTLALVYGVSASAIRSIINRRTWKHLPEEPS